VGARYEISPRFRVLGDLTYFSWSGYIAEYFGENKKRDFSPVLKAAFGGEYYAPVRLFSKDAAIPLRLGFSYDRQPMRSPGSAYAIFSMGTGVHWGSIALDIGGQFGRESGSGSGLGVTRLSVSLRVGM